MYSYHAVHSIIKLFCIRGRKQLTSELDLLLVRISELQYRKGGKQ